MSRYICLCLLFLLVGCKKEMPAVAQKKPLKTFRHEMKGLPIDSVSLLQFKDELLLTFYQMNGFQTVWVEPKTRENIAEILLKSEEDGLEPTDYYVAKLQKYEKKINDLSQKELIDYDITITRALQKFAVHLSKGKANPRLLYRNWDLNPNIVDINLRLSEGLSGDSIARVIEKLKPTHFTYKRLKTALELINEYPKDKYLQKISADKKIVRNDTNNALVAIKKKLIYWKDMRAPDSLTNIYDRRTYKAIKRFQMRHGLGADGVIGKGTITALNFTRQQRKEQIIANLERWRWFPRNMGDHYFIINIPDYTLRVIKDNDTIDERRVVVGKIDRKTPILSSTFNNIVFNPTWTVPPTIVREDLTPSAIKDRSYFAVREITIYNWRGDTIAPENWKPEKYNSYRYVQRPGNDNSLGTVKFNFPNHYTVYLHDTNHRDYFIKHYRSLSSGCVRVENPLPLAEYMLNDEKNWSLDSIIKIIETRKTTIVPLKEKIRIHQLYWTAWSEYNILIFRDDIYNLDAALYDALRK